MYKRVSLSHFGVVMFMLKHVGFLQDQDRLFMLNPYKIQF